MWPTVVKLCPRRGHGYTPGDLGAFGFSFFHSHLLACSSYILKQTEQSLLCRHECFNRKYTIYRIHMKLHLGPKWHIFHILTSEDVDNVISHFFIVFCANSKFIYMIKRKLHGCLKIWISSSWVKNNILLTHSTGW